MAFAGIVIALVIAAFSYLVWALAPSKAQRWIRAVPGPPPLPIIGNAHQLEHTAYGFFNQVLGYCREYSKEGICKVMLGPQPTLLLYKADTVGILFNSTKHMAKSPDYRFLHPWLGTGLLTSKGSKWQYRRKLLTPTFHFRILQDFVGVFNEQSQVMVQRLKGKAGTGKFDIFNYITLCALDIICDTAMGKNVSAQSNSESEYVKAIYKTGELVQVRQKSPWFWPNVMYNTFGAGKEFQRCLQVLHGFTQKVIQERSEELEKQMSQSSEKMETDISKIQEGNIAMIGSRKRLAFLDMLLYAAQGDAKLDFSDIREEVDTFMFEGHDTTAAAMNWVVHLVGAHPEVQAKIHEEMDRVFGGDRIRDVSMDDIKDMRYLDCVIKEALRLFPSVPFFARTISEDCEIGGYKIAEETVAIVVTYALHRDPEHFPDPEKFDPDRFLPENSRGRHPYCYVPFSAGMRNCIGQKFALNEEKVVLSAIFRNFSVTSCQTRDELRPIGELILRPEKGVLVKVEERPM